METAYIPGLNRYATQFDFNAKYNDQEDWPFWTPLVPEPDLEQSEFWGGLGRPGWFIPAGGSRDVIITTAQDGAYRLINYKLSVYSPQPDASDGAEAGTITSINAVTGAVVGLGTNFLNYFTNPGGMLQYVTTDATPNNFAFLPVSRVVSNTSMFVDVGAMPLHTVNAGQAWSKAGMVKFQTTAAFASILPGAATPAIGNIFKYVSLMENIYVELVAKSNKAVNLTGGLQKGALNAQVPDAIKQSTLQGQRNGLGQLRIPFSVPNDGVLLMRITNRNPKDVFVDGHLFGYKVVLDTGSRYAA